MSRVKRVIVLRHGERLDHIMPAWAASAARAHDSPLSDLGRQQAEQAGAHFRERLQPSENEDIVYVSSPLIRTVQTAKNFIQGVLGEAPTTPLLVEPCIAETEGAIRKRMMSTHPSSVPKKEGVHSGLCTPVLLEAGDLMSIYPFVNFDHKPLRRLAYNQEGYELDPVSLEPTTTPKRIAGCMPGLLSHDWGTESGRDVTLVLVTHGGVVKSIVQELTHSDEPPAVVAYCETFELRPVAGGEACTPEGGRAFPKWEVVYSWVKQGTTGHDGSDTSKAD